MYFSSFLRHPALTYTPTKMGALLSKSTNDKQPKTSKRSARKNLQQPQHNQLNASSNTNTTNLTTLADDSTCTSAADVSAISAPSTAIDNDQLASCTPAHVQPFIDPRSPFICRTPIDARGGSPAAANPFAVTRRLDLTTDDASLMMSTPTSRILPGGQKSALQQKLLKNLGYQEFDPRSPTMFINRTPMRLDGELMGVGASCTFAAGEVHANAEEANNALNESMDRPAESVNNEINESIQATELPADAADQCPIALAPVDEELMIPQSNTNALEPETMTPPAKSAVVAEDVEDLVKDPRSPSINVDRTPIVLLTHSTSEVDDVDTVDSTDANIQVPMVQPLPEPEPSTTATNDGIFKDAEVESVCTTPRKTFAVSKRPNEALQPRTPLGCLANQNKGRQSLLMSAGGHKQPKHPILFVGKHQKQQTQYGDSKIPVMKSVVGGGSNSNVWKM